MRKTEKKYSDYHKVSEYDKSDYRSFLYKGDWVKHQIDEIVKEALNNKNSIFKTIFQKEFLHKEHLPQKLYKFYPFTQNSLKCIENDSIYLNESSNFNDPFDSLIQTNKQEFLKRYILGKIEETNLLKRNIITETEYYTLVHSVCDNSYNENYNLYGKKFFDVFLKLSNEKEFVSDWYVYANRIFDQTMVEIKRRSMRICCFSSLNDDELSKYMEMWGHYTDSHKGFCVEYDFSNYLIRLKENNINKLETAILNCIFPCLYKSVPVFLSPLIFYKIALKKHLTNHQTVLLEKSILNSHIYKSTSWSYEKEWRIIMPDEISSIWNYLLPFPYIKSIYLGVNMKKDDKEYLYKIGKRKNIEIYDAKLNGYNYKLDFYKVNTERYFKEQNEDRVIALNNKLNFYYNTK